jgi:hypothetical protein
MNNHLFDPETGELKSCSNCAYRVPDQYHKGGRWDYCALSGVYCHLERIHNTKCGKSFETGWVKRPKPPQPPPPPPIPDWLVIIFIIVAVAILIFACVVEVP